MHASEVTPEVTRTANQLYWTSDKSVNQIAEELELSKGALYGIIAPEPTEFACPLCGGHVGYPNRTAKERDLVDCPSCDWDGSADETVGLRTARVQDRDPHRVTDHDEDHDADDHADRDRDGFDMRGNGALPAEASANASPTLPTPPPPFLTPRMSTIAGGALIGAAVGLALVLWARRR